MFKYTVNNGNIIIKDGIVNKVIAPDRFVKPAPPQLGYNYTLPKEIEKVVADGIIAINESGDTLEVVYKMSPKKIAQIKLDSTIVPNSTRSTTTKRLPQNMLSKNYHFWVGETYFYLNFRKHNEKYDIDTIYLLENEGVPYPTLNLYDNTSIDIPFFGKTKAYKYCIGYTFMNQSTKNLEGTLASIGGFVSGILSSPSNMDLSIRGRNQVCNSPYSLSIATNVHYMFLQLSRLHSLIKNEKEAKRWYNKHRKNLGYVYEQLLNRGLKDDLSDLL